MLTHGLRRLAMEPPFRIVSRAVLSRLPLTPLTRARWDISPRPAYLLGLTIAAKKAREAGLSHLCALEFGVAFGAGLAALEREAAAVERATGVRFTVYGFDAGEGLPATTGDYRDHPDYWQGGDFKMDADAVRRQLGPRAHLVLGRVRETVAAFVEETQPAPIGFASFDLDLYTSTRDALLVFQQPKTRMLPQTPLYFDDIVPLISHRFAGELLAIDEFNTSQDRVRIDRWHNLRHGRPFPEAGYLSSMFVAHDLAGINAVQPRNHTRQRDHLSGKG